MSRCRRRIHLTLQGLLLGEAVPFDERLTISPLVALKKLGCSGADNILGSDPEDHSADWLMV